MTRTQGWRASVVALCAAVGVATAFGPGGPAVMRPGAGVAVVSVADTIRAVGMLAEAAPGVSKRDESS